ncbi:MULTISPECIES: GyrI-like domain-containing protein [Vagococcus]|uniref:GyrI-like small molecule binding domain-containing protein n=1 Tax=Vagococcus fluvialis bH819 TaxID=1255619 RepID=A0A1X6WQI4_9ENTE|nr:MULTISPECIES: GyrI-like domain-containing protein [Vagococcus]SLM86593.1 hypothetical protein FM121_10900 [Vagococcus fluvialis bH819]HCM90801.1 hypothetical protein [Vagococcus sp.]
MKYEWRKQEKELYLPKGIDIRQIKKQSFLILEGMGDPNNNCHYLEQIEALYSVSYSLRMTLKKQGFEYTVYPLEGVWTTSDGSKDENLNKDALVYRMMIRQPESVTDEMVQVAIKEVHLKKRNELVKEIVFETYEEGTVIQSIHIGSFDTEIETFKKMDQFLEKTNDSKDWIMGKYAHREIYLSDFRRVMPEKRKTLLRYKLKEK